MKHLILIILSFFLLLTSCRQENDFQLISKSSLSKELIETKADSGLLILLKDSKVVAKVNLVLEDSLYRESNEQAFQMERDMRTLLSPAYLMAASDFISDPKEGYPFGGMMCGDVIKGVVEGIDEYYAKSYRKRSILYPY